MIKEQLSLVILGVFVLPVVLWAEAPLENRLDELQFVESFSSIVSFSTTTDTYPNFRGGEKSWWMYCTTTPQEISWLTAPVTEKKTTCFVWVGNNSGGYSELAMLYLNDEKIMLIESNVREDKVWYGNKCRLFFDFRGYHLGNSGIYFLTVPADKVTPGKPCKIKISYPGQGITLPDGAWFMVSRHSDVISSQGPETLKKAYLASFQSDKKREYKITEVKEKSDNPRFFCFEFSRHCNQAVSREQLDKLEFSDWFRQKNVLVGGEYPFVVATEGRNILATSLPEEQELSIPLNKKASRVFLLMGADFGKYIAGYKKVGRQINSIEEPDQFVVRIVYADGEEEEVFPENVQTKSHSISEKLSLYSVRPRFYKTIRKLVICDRMKNGSFLVAACTLETTPPETPTEAATSLPIQTPVQLKEMSPKIELTDKILVLENTYYRYSFGIRGPFELKEIYNKFIGDNCVKGRGNFFSIDVGPRTIPSSLCRVKRINRLGGKEVQVTLVPENPSVPLLIKLNLRMDSSAQLISSLSVENRGDETITLRVFFPDLKELKLGDDIESNYYYFPYRGGIVGKVPFEINPNGFNGIYGNIIAIQVMDLYSEKLNGGLYLLARDSDSTYKNFFIQKGDMFSMGLAYFERELAPEQLYTPPDAGLGVHSGGWREAISAYKKWLPTWFDTSHLDDPRREWFKKINMVSMGHGMVWDNKRVDFEKTLARGVNYGGYPLVTFSFPWQEFYDDASLKMSPWKVQAIKTAVKEFHQKGVRVCAWTGFMVGLPDDCRLAELFGKKWARLKKDGSSYSDWQEAPIMFCQGFPEFQDAAARIAARIVKEFDIDVLYIDILGATPRQLCYNPLHNHPSPGIGAKGSMEFLEKMRTAIDKVKPEVVISGEALGTDAMMQIMAHNMPFNLLDYSPQTELPFIDLPRFVHPRTKFFSILSWGEDRHLRRMGFFNGEGYYHQEEVTPENPSRPFTSKGQRLVKKIKTILDEHYDAFTTLNPTPLIFTGNSDLYANRFPANNKAKVVYTFYNPTWQTIKIEFPIDETASFCRDLWNEKDLKITKADGKLTVPVEVGPRDVGCVVVSLRKK